MGHNYVSVFDVCNKVLVKSCVHFYNEFWKRRCVVLYNLEVQLKVFKEEVEVIMEEANAEEIEGLSRHVQTHKINSNEAISEEIFSWVRSVRVFKSRARKSEYPYMRNLRNVIMN